MSSAFEELVYVRTYARWLEEEKRREMWPETVARYQAFMRLRVPDAHKEAFDRACEAIERKEVMPSMRALWTAGPALERSGVASFNCAYTAIESFKDFADVLFILMNGSGVGFSVERQVIAKLPVLPEGFVLVDDVVIFEDSKEGWAQGYWELLRFLAIGMVPKLDFSLVRPKGARLKTFGGRASGPKPLEKLCKHTVKAFVNAAGRKLTSLECHDILCHIADIVVVGGVRRAATISLSNLSDRRMAKAKEGDFYVLNPQRARSNNSVAYTEKPDCQTFMAEWAGLVASQTGERGIFNRESAILWAKKAGRKLSPEALLTVGCNPCGEVLLQSKSFCNLTEVVVRPGDSFASLKDKVRHATVLGCVQASLTHFHFIDPKWKENAEAERLLGVSLTGIMDNEHLGDPFQQVDVTLMLLREHAHAVAEEWFEIMGFGVKPTAITCVKPSGTVSSLLGTSSGLHTRYAPFYLRRIRVAVVDPLFKMLRDQGFPFGPEVNESEEFMTTAVFTFPFASPPLAVCREDRDAVQQLETWLLYKTHWCDHSPSVTIYVKDCEWLKVGAWVYDHWNAITGLTFLPYDGGIYQLSPFEEITEKQYWDAVKKLPPIDYRQLSRYEMADNTEGAKEFACAGGGCDVA